MKTHESIKETLNEDIKYLLVDSSPMLGIKARVSIAARLNFAGVFTDVPPFCYEYGGKVVNTSILIDGKYPVVAEAESNLNDDLIFEYTDSKGNRQVEENHFKISETVKNDVFLVQSAVCNLLGISGGVKLSITANIPCGSGLGTSSISAAACLKAVYALYNVEVDDMEIVSKVLVIEQIIGSGGGWQDQCGGMFPGLKLCSSSPGLPQKINIEVLSKNNPISEIIEKSTIIIYSGNRRYSKDILSGIINKVLDSDSETLEILNKMKDIADKMAAAIRTGDIRIFKKLVSEQSILNKRISKEYFNKKLEQLEEKLSYYCDASIVSGAGGGGFFAAVLKDGADYQLFKEYMMSGEYPCEPKKVDFCLDKPAYLVEFVEMGEKNA